MRTDEARCTTSAASTRTLMTVKPVKPHCLLVRDISTNICRRRASKRSRWRKLVVIAMMGSRSAHFEQLPCPEENASFEAPFPSSYRSGGLGQRAHCQESCPSSDTRRTFLHDAVCCKGRRQ